MLINTLSLISVYTMDILTDILSYIDLGLLWVSVQETWVQLVIWAVVAILILIGLFAFLKKAIKVFLVIAVIGGILYLLNMAEVINIQEIINSITGAFGAFVIY